MSARPVRRARFIGLACVLGLAAFLAGAQLVTRRPRPPVHPLTGRQVAGIATNAGWLDRAACEREEVLRSIRQALKPEGRLVLVEYRKEDAGLPIALTHRMSLPEARVEIEAEGFTFDTALEQLPRQHIIVFRR
jgi:hypothetical protein